MEKCESLERLFDKYFYAHRAYQYKLPNAQAMKQAEEQHEEQEISCRNFADKITEWINNKDSRSEYVPNTSPNDSASQVASKVLLSRQSARSAVTSALSAKEATRIAKLMVQAKLYETQQRLEQEKLRLQQEETRVMLEMEIAKTAAKEKTLRPHRYRNRLFLIHLKMREFSMAD